MFTKSQISATTLCAALCAALIAAPSQGSARRPQARVESATIQTVDQNACVLRVQRYGNAIPLTLAWNSRTIFVEGARVVTSATLTKGTPVKVWYRTPLFGKRFATKIVIERGLAHPIQRRQPPSASAKL
jgi:hypothetical protein